MKKLPSLILAACLMALGSLAAADQPSQLSPAVADKSVERLAGLAKVWGAVKFFHPYLAYKDIDWDKALVETIPRVRAAASAEDYQSALGHLLSFLQDPASRASLNKSVQKTAAAPSAPTSPAPLEVKWPAPDIAYLASGRAAQFANPKHARDFDNLFREAARKAKALIIDIRRFDRATEDEGGDYYFYSTLTSTLSSILCRDIPLPSSRHIMYSGFPTQRGSSSGGYYSAFVYVGASPLPGTAEQPSPISLIFLADSASSVYYPLLNGLQISGAALVVQEGPAAAERVTAVHRMDLPDGVTVVFRTAESINPDGSTGFAAALTLPAPPPGAPDAAYQAALDIAQGRRAVSRLQSQSQTLNPCLQPRRDNPYSEKSYPSAEYRLLALFRFWNTIHYFFPYKHLLDRPWGEILTEFIPRIEKAKDATDYVLTVAEMVSQVKDTHGFVNSQTLNAYFGMYFPPLEVKLIEGQTIVTGIVQDPKAPGLGIETGDVVMAVDGEGTFQRRERLGRLVAASTPQALDWRVHGLLLGGAKDSPIRLTLKNRKGQIVEKTLTRTSRAIRMQRTSPVFRILPEGYGYIDLARLNIDQVDLALETVKETPALIFDVRGYPRGTAWAITPRLIDKRKAVAKFQRPELHGNSIDWPSRVSFDQEIEPSPGWKYRGKIVVLINEEAISQAEHTCLFFEAAAGATFVGSPTNGANGDVTAMVLPGEIYVNFTGHDVRHADGSQLQRVGIQPHILVRPTIEGIRQGRDEVLEKAIESLKVPKSKKGFSGAGNNSRKRQLSLTQDEVRKVWSGT